MAAKFYPIETYLRVRPRGANSVAEYAVSAAEMVDGSERGLFDLSIPPDAAPGLVHNNTTGHVEYEFDAIFGEEASQEDVFDIIARDKVDNLLAGENSTIFAYGQTGSGKTYSIFGGETFSERGLIPRALGLVFATMAQKQAEGKSNVKLRLSFTEVYGEAVFDLLDPQKRYISMEQWTPVQILEADGELVLRNLNVYEVEKEEDALSLFFMGNTNRITSVCPQPHSHYCPN
jgi:kinesin family protein 6/9